MPAALSHLIRRAAALVAAVAVCLISAAPGAHAQGYETEATAAYVIDHGTGQVLFSRNADVPLPPASMSKLMTLLMAFEALRDGRLTLDTRVPVSAHAMSFGGSTMFLNTTDRPTVEDLIRGIIIVSGNDASVALAEALSPDGTEAGFARIATDRARELGMSSTTLMNASGWPAPGHVMSMRDLAILAEEIITEHPQYYRYFAETEFDYENRSPANRFNRNPLLAMGIGADGLKTGHTQEAGYGLVGSAVQGNRRVTFVITGLSSAEARARESERILSWAFRQFVERQVVTGGTELARAPVFMGTAADVGLAAAGDLTLLLPATGETGLQAEITYTGPVPAPIEAGATLGELVVRVGEGDTAVEHRIPMVATEAVPQGGIGIRLGTAARAVLHELLGPPPTAVGG
ncbi:D-alanyl-D-alanine carboxypeptidase family protein [Roseicyclus persicicus]|uniref:serine-type D-Ala-D-Ala carboxypeptidase n=1 Tax=Roseicyclus persicicus TaxID=2650661 RepID=A0A7X6GXW3_9RHOB|nr:D-alanyl-D-alanine carboxypeptidase family protein [Roseibacterium persicicum]NKX44424.1 D-alanyl-D-alanine carboxypeptidase [Roseibacterium persicicum]